MLRSRSQLGQRWKSMQHYRFPVVFTSLIIILLVYTFTVSKNEQEPMSLDHEGINLQSFVQLKPTSEFRNGTNVISQIPYYPKAVLLLAHGCNGKAANFWDSSPGCPNCVGLPEERLIVLRALAQKYAVLAVSSVGRCWTFGDERVIVKGIIEWWVEKNKLGKLPLVALGASSGGYFVSVLANDIKFSSIVVMIAEGVFEGMDIPRNYPPTFFVHMPKDRRRMLLIAQNMEALRQKGVDVAEAKCTEFPLTPYFLSERIPGIDEAVSFELVELLHKEGFVDENGLMRKDGRATPWKEALARRKNVSLDKNKLDHIQEELNLAFAYHEMTSLQNKEIFNWFESHMR